MNSSFRYSLLAGAFTAFATLSVHAQTAPDAGSLLREIERQPRQLPQPGPQAVPQAPVVEAADTVRVTVKAFKLSGNTLIAEPELQAVLAPWVGREVSFGELQKAANAIAEAYRKRGWFARPQLPAQDVSSGVILINILEGRLGAVRIDDGGKELRLDRTMVSDTMTARQKPGDPLNLDDLERSSNILNDTPGVAVATILTTGKTLAESDAVIKVQDKPLFTGTAQLDNTGSRSTGDQKLSLSATLDNPGGKGDQLSANANASEGSSYLKLAYSLAVGNDGLRVGVNASALQYKLVGADFAALKSKGDAQTVGFNSNYPLLRSGTRNISIAAAFDRKSYYNEANAVATSTKLIHVGLLSLTGDILDGLGAGGMTLWGVNLTTGNVDLSGNTVNKSSDNNGARTAGSYQKLGGNLARLQRLSDQVTLWAAVNGQVAGKNLDSSEKLSLGGPSGVRAYPVLEGIGDDGYVATLESRYSATSEVQLTAFYDYGSIRRDHNARYVGALNPETAALQGAGVGVNWTKAGSFAVRASVARRIGDNPLRSILTGKDQDGSLDRTRFWLTAVAFF
ncbi:MAG: ShlB/FhaC/HecB family hemolysin secretion/activation protein [Betaproteobacteria bacterium]